MTNELKITYKKISTLKPAEYNPRKMSDKDRKSIRESIEQFGLVDPIVVNQHKDRKNVIVGGHQRVIIAKELGLKEVPCVYVSLDLDREKELNIRLNKNVAGWDMQKLFEEFEIHELKDWGFSDSDLVFEDDDPTPPPEPPLPDPPKNPKSKPDHIYQLGNHRLMCGDSTSEKDITALMNGSKAELLFTSPPYSDIRDYNKDKNLDISHLSKFIGAYKKHVKYQAINLGLKINDSQIIQYWDEYIKSGAEAGYKLMAWNVWHKNTVSIGPQSQFFPCYHEWIFVFGMDRKLLNRTQEKKTVVQQPKTLFRRQQDGTTKKSGTGNTSYKLKMMESVFRSNPELGDIRKKHPAIFPVELPSEYIKAMTHKNDIVVDAFGGSGSTLIACDQSNRNCYTMELDPAYCDVIVQRYCNLNELDTADVFKSGKAMG